MERATVLSKLQSYVARNLLEGMDVGLNENTPLLEWGVINSLEIVRLLTFIQTEFQVEVPANEIVASNFINLAAITNLVMAHLEIHAE
jgi:acyl carrier protein